MRWVSFLAEPAGEWVGYPESVLLIVIISLAGLGTGILFFASLVAYYRRRTRLYAVVAVVVGALLARTIIGLGTVFGMVSMPVHHLVAHGLDFAIAALILYAVYTTGEGGVQR